MLAKKVFAALIAASLHLMVVVFLLRDQIALPITKIGQSVIVQILQTENHPPENLTLRPLNLDEAPSILVDPPQLDLPLGEPAVSKPMVVISAKFAPNTELVVPASEYPTSLPKISGVYRAEISAQVLDNGTTGNVYVEHSDGDQMLDNFIMTYGWSHWRFMPSLNDGVPVMSWKTVYVEMTTKEMAMR